MNETKQPSSTQQKDKGIFKNAYQERGQAMVETAFVMIILLLLLSLIIDLGRAFFTYLALQNAAGEGAYYAAKDPDPNEIRFRIRHESPESPLITEPRLINWEDIEDDDIAITFWCPPLPQDLDDPTPEEVERRIDEDESVQVPSGAFVVVSVTYQFETIGPVAGMVGLVLPGDWDDSFPLRAETKQLVLQAGPGSVPCGS